MSVDHRPCAGVGWRYEGHEPPDRSKDMTEPTLPPVRVVTRQVVPADEWIESVAGKLTTSDLIGAIHEGDRPELSDALVNADDAGEALEVLRQLVIELGDDVVRDRFRDIVRKRLRKELADHAALDEAARLARKEQALEQQLREIRERRLGVGLLHAQEASDRMMAVGLLRYLEMSKRERGVRKEQSDAGRRGAKRRWGEPVKPEQARAWVEARRERDESGMDTKTFTDCCIEVAKWYGVDRTTISNACKEAGLGPWKYRKGRACA